MFPRNPSSVARYTFTVLVVTLATLLRFALVPILGLEVPFILYFPTIVLGAWFGGLWPGLLSTALGSVIAWYAFFPPQYSFAVTDPSAPTQVIIFSVAGTLISLLAESLHRARRKSEASEAREREQREQYRVTLGSIGDAVIATDAAGRVSFINPIAESLTGWEQETALGRPLAEVFHIVNEPTRQEVENPALRAIKEGVIFGLANHTLLIAKDGTERPIDDSGAPIKDAAGKTLGAVLIFRDITERRRVEKERALLAAIVESSGDAIISKNLDGIIESWNVAAEHLFEYTASEALGQPITLIIPPERLEEEQLILERLHRGERIEHFETVRRAKSGRAVDISLTVSPIRDAEGRIIGASKIARDITERRLAEEERAQLLRSERATRAQAEAASRAKDEFVALVSHELRAPLNSVLGWVQLLRTGKFNPAETQRALETIERNAKTQVQLIEDLLDISRVITGKLTLNAHPLELAPFVEVALESIRPAVEAKTIQLQVQLAARGSEVLGDPARLQQIVWNLLSNAVKFTPNHGRIEVRLEHLNSHLQLTVSDSGVGISPEFLPFVFDRFSQANTSSERKYGGLGLGLAIVRHLVELHGGAVRAESPGEGQGATFTVMLPVRATQEAEVEFKRAAPSIEAIAELTEAITLDGLRVLVVDDEAESRELLQAILTQRGAEVRACASAAETLTTIAQWRPAVLVSDIAMPEEDGYALIRKLRALPAADGGNIPAVALTGFARSEDRTRALAAGFQMHVPKPVEAVELIMVIASLAGRLDESWPG
jgi:PAS domain S-box-containing protein